MSKTIYFAGGCFWGVEHYFSSIRGVLHTQVGYANGLTASPTYEQVCHEQTGHAETVLVEYDDGRLSLPYLLHLFYEIIDPTAVDRQGPDVGRQYRTGIYYTDLEQERLIRCSLKELEKKFDRPLAVEVEPIKQFYPAEEYHQAYLTEHPDGYCHIRPDLFDKAKHLPYEKQTEDELHQVLSEEQFEVTQHERTERPFTNAYFDTFEPGIYVDITTGAPLFLSTDKFDSGCGWPSFTKPAEDSSVYEREDLSHYMHRREVRSKIGDTHLGHVFTDGPKESGGLRYCINSASLRFIPYDKMAEEGYAAYLPLLKKE